MWNDPYGSGRQEPDNWYDSAVICKNGHVITSMAKSYPDDAVKFCQRCGAENISQCLNCNEGIRGYEHIDGVLGGPEYSRPRFCIHCANAYPWTEAAIEAAMELAQELEGLDQNEKDTLKDSIGELVRDTPKTVVATSRFKTLVAKAGKGTAELFRSLLVDVASEAVKKSLWP